MATAQDIRYRTLAEFLAWEERQADRYERVSGVVWMMTGGTVDHNRITLNVANALRQRLQEGRCEAFVNDSKVVSPQEDVMYPDVLVAGGDLPGQASLLEAPVLVVEVLSQSTASRDHGRKRWAYQTIASLEHYLLIDQSQPVVEVASRAADGSWRSVIHRGLEGGAQLPALGVEIGLAEIFARVTFTSAAAVAEPVDRSD